MFHVQIVNGDKHIIGCTVSYIEEEEGRQDGLMFSSLCSKGLVSSSVVLNC